MDTDEAKIREMVDTTRAMILPSFSESTVSAQQLRSLKPPKKRGPVWIAPFTHRAALKETNEGLRNWLQRCLDSMSTSEETKDLVPPISEVSGEWTGYRTGVERNEEHPELEDHKAYENIKSTCDPQKVIMYIPGGIFVLNNAASRRTTTFRLSKLTSARCFTISYRLAPQNPFPAALLDVIFAYLSLLYPTLGSLHEAVPASSIILAADSVGASLALALIQLILYEQRNSGAAGARIPFNGQMVDLPLPAGVTGLSSSLEHALCLPSYIERVPFDCVPPDAPYGSPEFPSCELWPSKVPRAHTYCDASLLAHPLVSPATAKDWSGAPPMWFASGEEALAEATMVVAALASRQGVRVGWTEWSLMPHVWPFIFTKWWQTEDAMQEWGSACNAMFKRDFEGRGYIKKVNREVQSVEVQQLTQMTPQEVAGHIKKKALGMKPYVGRTGETSKL